MPNWPFSDPPNVAVIAHKRIVQRKDWIAYVSHDADDGSWQFHVVSDAPPSEADVAVVSLKSIFEIDPTIEELADLPLGWQAWRESETAQWQRSQK